MRSQPDLDRIVRSWLREDEREDADRVLAQVLREVDTTRQRRPGWPARMVPGITRSTVRFGIGAAAVILVGILGLRVLPATVGGPEPQPTPTPGFTTSLRVPAADPPIEVVVRSDTPWTRSSAGALVRPVPEASEGTSLSLWVLDTVYLDPCHWTTSDTIDRSLLGSAEGIATALSEGWAGDAPGSSADGPPTVVRVSPTTVDGHAGQRVELQVRPDIELDACDWNSYVFWADPVGGRHWAETPGQTTDVVVLDVGGQAIAIAVTTALGTPPDDRAELARMLATLDIVP